MSRRLARRGVSASSVDLGPDTIRYWSGGEGPSTIVLLHGFGGDALWQWHPQLQVLSQHHRVIAPDLLWFGGSESKDPKYSVAHQAKAVASLLDHLEIERAHVVGLSYGGMVAHELAGMLPERIERLILVSSPARSFHVDDQHTLLSRYDAKSVSELLLPDDPWDVKRLMALAYAKPPPVPPFIRREIIAEFYTDRRKQLETLLANVDRDMTDLRLRYVVPHHPTLILWGEHDEVFPTPTAKRVVKELQPYAQLCVLDDAAHAPNLERPGAVNRIILAFVSHGRVDCELANPVR